jgi:ABC-type glycerol-3-phosphate transport system permease component
MAEAAYKDSGVVKRLEVRDVVIRVLLALWALAIILPLIWVVYTSLKTNQEFFMGAWQLPKSMQWNNYYRAWTQLGIGQSFVNTIILITGAMLLNTFIVGLGCYTLARFDFKGRDIIYWYIIGSYFITGLNTMVTGYILMRKLGLLNSLFGLIINYGAAPIVFNTLILNAFMKGQPKELEEAAYIDGASYWQTFWYLGIPLARPALLTINVFNFMGYYNNFIKPLLYIRDPEKYPLSVAIYSMAQAMTYRADWVTLFAGFVIMMIPTILIYSIFQNQIIQNLNIGALKG